MQLSVPRRAVADSKSFPTEPDDVEAWIGALEPLASDADARLVQRGLMHSNRLHNEPDRRRAVLRHFLPVLDDLHEQLSKLSQAQPLPLIPAFARAARLLESLLREEAFAFKILLSDRETPDPDDARMAMRAFARQVLVALHGYRRPSARLLADAETLYLFAESNGLLDTDGSNRHSTTGDYFRLILLSGVIDTGRIRASQLPLTLDFLAESLSAIELRTIETSNAGDRFAVVLGEGVAPAPTPSLIVNDPDRVRVFGIDSLLDRIDTRIFRTPASRGNLLGVETLEHHTLERLRASIGPAVARRSARVISCSETEPRFGHKEIVSGFLFDTARARHASQSAHPDSGSQPWTVVNRSADGVCLKNSACRPGSVQVGDLVGFELPPKGEDTLAFGSAERSSISGSRRSAAGSDAGSAAGSAAEKNGTDSIPDIPAGVSTEDSPAAGSRDGPAGDAPEMFASEPLRECIGKICWLGADEHGLTIGVEFLAHQLVPVSVAARDAESPFRESGMIINGDVGNRRESSILLPPYLYRTGDVLSVTEILARAGDRPSGGATREFKLIGSLQSNDLFSHFLID